jgi:periplasmic mercuric ion binding protein
MKRSLIVTTGVLALTAAILASELMLCSPYTQTVAAQGAAAARTAAEQTATFAVENMTCALCRVTVKKAMAGVNGVRSVAVDFEGKMARVVFDPSVTTLDAIAAASANAGYPAQPRN